MTAPNQQPPSLPPLHESRLPNVHPLYRPRHGGHQWVALVCALVFFVPPVLALLLGARPVEFENRKLADFPSLGADFFPGLSRWATDHLPFRPDAVHAANGISRGVFGEPAPFNQGHNDQAGPLPAPSPETETRPAVPNGPDPNRPNLNDPNLYRKVLEGKDGWLYYGFDADAKCTPAKPLDETIQRIQRLRQVVEASGRKFVFLVAPDKSTMEPDKLPDSFAGKDCWDAASTTFWQRVPTETGAIDVRPRLIQTEQAVHHPVYHQLDTHWTDEGGIAMARVVAERLQPGITGTWRTEQGKEWASYADLPPLLGSSGANRGNYYSLEPDGHDNRTQELRSDYNKSIVHFGSAPTTGTIADRVGLLGDSFTQPAARYLAAAFNDIQLAHYGMLSTNPDDVLRMLDSQQTIVVEMVERTVTNGKAELLDPAIIDRIGQELAKHPVR
ncbi:hypothetical protein F0L68_13845 [Solihabitans fulvus]|uniref:AlgX/AlgJ SGNH hydrolase-like domain-containing protein n=1 Tax=Solihabitans fulvus TaxID=1892852 RepID=A0A5B2XF05_9PSEU|nr:hypothetical protein [Solihabitans fulvus]KAA2262347.1 hypothetical protein F0L68_13845 [Solihabitans fulvus]